MAEKLIFEYDDLKLYQTGKDQFRVVYGLQVRGGLSYTEAAHELGECLFHALACEGKLTG